MTKCIVKCNNFVPILDGRNGLFLVRESNSSTGDYVLSVFHNDQVNHYQIRRHIDDAFFSISIYQNVLMYGLFQKDLGLIFLKHTPYYSNTTIFLAECLKFHGLEILIDYYTKTPVAENVVLTDYIPKYPPPHDSRRHGRRNLLHRATDHGNYTVVSELLKTDYPHDAKNQDGQTAVHLASISGQNDILTKLIECGAGVNLRDSAGFTPLHVCYKFQTFSEL